MMYSRFLIVGLVSVALACAMALVFYRHFGSPGNAPRVDARTVVVAAIDLPVGAQIRPEDVRIVQVPRAFAPANCLERVNEVKGRVVVNPIWKNEPLVSNRLAPAGSGPGLAPMIPAGFRAVAVRVNDVIGVAGFIQPGMRVDVLASGRPPNVEDSVTRTVLQNVVVLSAGQVLQPEPKGQVINAQVVTLQVTPEQAEVLTLTSGEGRIQLVLRNSTDTKVEQTPGARLTAIYATGERAVKAPAIHAVDPSRAQARGIVAAPAALNSKPLEPPTLESPKSRTIEVIRGTVRSNVTAGGD